MGGLTRGFIDPIMSHEFIPKRYSVYDTQPLLGK